MRSNALRKEPEEESAEQLPGLRLLRPTTASVEELEVVLAPVAPLVIAALVMGALFAAYAALGIWMPGLGLPAPAFPAGLGGF